MGSAVHVACYFSGGLHTAAGALPLYAAVGTTAVVSGVVLRLLVFWHTQHDKRNASEHCMLHSVPSGLMSRSVTAAAAACVDRQHTESIS
jgi:hypothetical protein